MTSSEATRSDAIRVESPPPAQAAPVRPRSHLAYFYGHLRSRLIFVAVLCVITGALDGIGLTMFLPLLQMADGSSTVNPAELGRARVIFDVLQSTGMVLTLPLVLFLLCVFFTLKGIVVYGSNAYRVTVQQHFVRIIRLATLDALGGLLYKKFVTTDLGRIQNTMSGEVARLSLALSSYVGALQNVVLVCVYVIFAILINAEFSILVAGGAWLTFLLSRRIYAVTKRTSQELTKESHAYQGLLLQFVGSFKYLKATGTLATFAEYLRRQILRIERNNRKLGMLAAVMSSIREPTMIIVVAACVFVQTSILQTPLGAILVSLLFFYRALSSLLALQTHWNSFLTVSGSMENMATFHRELTTHRETCGRQTPARLAREICLEDVALRYDDRLALRGVTLTIRRNETVALVGESGSGKTSLLNIIAGLLPPDYGSLQIDGVSSTELNLAEFQRRIGYITQEPVVFNATIFENVTFWSPPTEENHARFREAVRRASISGFIDSYPAKEQTMLGNNGINISGGQKQRIAIARELYKDIDVLIMDEATSALDSETERSIQENIESLKGKYTLLISAHRLSTVKTADRIVLMKEGVVLEIGTYDELVRRSPYFQRMVELQELR